MAFDYQTGSPDMRDPAPFPGEHERPGIDGVRDAADMMREGLTLVMDAAGHNPTRVYVAVCRLAGLSMDEIGKHTGMSKQGVQKHVRCIERREVRLRGLFTSKRLRVVPALLPRREAKKYGCE